MSAQKTILCVEDEDDLRTDLAEELDAAGYRVLQASNGSEALSLLENERPDLVLCDITMPGLGGYDVLKALREQGDMADVPFIFLTALAEREVATMLDGAYATLDGERLKLTRKGYPFADRFALQLITAVERRLPDTAEGRHRPMPALAVLPR